MCPFEAGDSGIIHKRPVPGARYLVGVRCSGGEFIVHTTAFVSVFLLASFYHPRSFAVSASGLLVI